MKNFLNKYRIHIRIVAIILFVILAILKWVSYSETGDRNQMIGAAVWSILALVYILGMIIMIKNNKIAAGASLNNNSKGSAE